MFVWNLDWNDQGWVCDNIRFFSLRHVGGSAGLQHAGGAGQTPYSRRLLAEPTQFVCLADVDQPTLITGSAGLRDLGGCDAITWTVTLASSNTLQPTLPVTQGQLGGALTFTVNSGAYMVSGTGTVLLYPTGTYTALLTLSTLPGDVIASPQTIQIALIVAPKVYRLYLPVLVRGLQ